MDDALKKKKIYIWGVLIDKITVFKVELKFENRIQIIDRFVQFVA